MKILTFKLILSLICLLNDESLAADCYGASRCQCSFVSITCNNTNVDEIPFFPVYSNITSIVISNNQLKTFLISSKYSSVTSLVLCHNRMNEIFLSSFDLPNVKTLLLNNNHASYIQTNCTNMKNTLQIFSAANNLFRSSNFPDFAEFTQLYSIDFSNNLLTDIDHHLLPLDLQSLNLSINIIESFNHLKLNGLKMLTYLNISHNHLSELDLNKLPLSLKQLDASYNHIETIVNHVSNDQEDTLASYLLEKIFLQGNKIKSISHCKINLLNPISYSLLVNKIGDCRSSTEQELNKKPKLFSGNRRCILVWFIFVLLFFGSFFIFYFVAFKGKIKCFRRYQRSEAINGNAVAVSELIDNLSIASASGETSFSTVTHSIVETVTNSPPIYSEVNKEPHSSNSYEHVYQL